MYQQLKGCVKSGPMGVILFLFPSQNIFFTKIPCKLDLL